VVLLCFRKLAVRQKQVRLTLVQDIQQMLSHQMDLALYQNRSSGLASPLSSPPPSPAAAPSPPQPPSRITSDPSTDRIILGVKLRLWQVTIVPVLWVTSGWGNSQFRATSGPNHEPRSPNIALIGCPSVRQWSSFLGLRTVVRA
jgi:hypothetical protein